MTVTEAGNSERLALGVDIGGTKVAAVLVSGDGTVVARERGAVAPESNAAALASVVAVVDGVVAGWGGAAGGVEGRGAGAPGGVDWRNGVLLGATNLAWRNLPLAEQLTKRYG